MRLAWIRWPEFQNSLDRPDPKETKWVSRNVLFWRRTADAYLASRLLADLSKQSGHVMEKQKTRKASKSVKNLPVKTANAKTAKFLLTILRNPRMGG